MIIKNNAPVPIFVLNFSSHRDNFVFQFELDLSNFQFFSTIYRFPLRPLVWFRKIVLFCECGTDAFDFRDLRREEL